MVHTKGYKSQEEAAEAWNTWAGSLRVISREEYNKINNPIPRDYPIKDNKLDLPDGENAFGDLTIAENGGYESPWPRIYLADYANAENGLYGNDDMFMVYKLRARWRLIEKDHLKLRKILADLLGSNDKDNYTLNNQLQKWNAILNESGFPLFEDNDLRGADLSGLLIKSANEDRVFLRGLDLSYSECHLLKIAGANLYGAKLMGIKGAQIDLSHCTCHGASFQASFLPDCKFIGSDLGFSNFKNALLSHGIFDGANCSNSNFSSSLLLKTSLNYFVSDIASKRIYTDITDITWDDNTRFEEVLFNEFLKDQNVDLAKHIQELRNPTSMQEGITSALEVKPGAFGISLDLKRLLDTLRRAFRYKKKT